MGSRPLDDVNLLTVAEVADVLRLSRATVYRMVASGALPALKLGRSVRIPQVVVEQVVRHGTAERR